MPRSNNLSRQTSRNLKNSKFTKVIRTITPLLVASIVLVAAVALSISAESSGLGWLWKAQPAPASGKTEPVKSEPAISSAAQAPALNSTKAVNFMALPPAVATIVTATKTDTLLTDVDLDTQGRSRRHVEIYGGDWRHRRGRHRRYV